MPDATSGWERLAAATADAIGKPFVVGVRPFGKGWFANCDDVEWDGSTPDQAVRSVVESLRESLVKRSALAQKEREVTQIALVKIVAIERALASDDRPPCYECGHPVQPFDGEQHGRSGWVHYSCRDADEEQQPSDERDA